MSHRRIVVYDTIKVRPPMPTDPRLWAGICFVGGFLLAQTWASIEFQAVMQAPLANLPYTALISVLFGLTVLVEIAAGLAIIVLILAAIGLAARGLFRFVSRMFRVVRLK
jgi:hypothetical protein